MDEKVIKYLAQITTAVKALNKEKVEVGDITKIPGDVLDSLNVGDNVIKVTGKQKHLYVVTYKGAGSGEGICLSYNAAGYGETVSYDRSGDSWVYNSTDIKTYGE